MCVKYWKMHRCFDPLYNTTFLYYSKTVVFSSEPVKLQNPFGTCCGFASIAAAESSLLGSGLAAEDGYDENSLDLSE